MKRIPDTLLVGFLFVAFIGFMDAAYLTAKHYVGEIPPCSLASGCETVLTSPYATLGGNIPIALVGASYYLALFVGGIIYADTKNIAVLKTTAYFTTAGFVTSVILVSLQMFVIHALCLYCIASAITSTVLFILGVVILKKLKQTDSIGTMPILMR
ncbi:MAG: hypothetical protein A3J55_04590 [Candidatus Ryanbacteria bacterium RIFCSPHIGHO2_02_FULL_45_17b]|uniref:Vitamin K epoxide reductase domain-containing protein n=1 Tax=Candidatus Ryanbacteria bacterium RIFCSPHIGHO2_01_FULL_45_22 TaxID=1802114 RepID=A0A1G2G2G8_9BACT|nr:MAG: hypothetical protein A2719_05165 [Candidatus Ryanbacteria bacterium RIFCSPHIGHO2_01_FULL_45_22]OGZ47618.1 MAG: hypothetical protein A3J55_04590 [Candidatus Ryanbacteria bacterium RIFCSPHIGHO2_02_FULL_45_17b]